MRPVFETEINHYQPERLKPELDDELDELDELDPLDELEPLDQDEWLLVEMPLEKPLAAPNNDSLERRAAADSAI